MFFLASTILDPEIMNKVLIEAPEQMIKFKAYRRGHLPKKTNILGYKLTRVSNQKKLPYGVWANIVVESILFVRPIRTPIIRTLYFPNAQICRLL